MWVQPSTALSGVRNSCDSVARNSSFTRSASSAVARADLGRRDLPPQFGLAVDPLADVVDHRDRADDRAAVEERRDARRSAASSPADVGTSNQVTVKTVREDAGLSGERGVIVAVEAARGQLGKHLEQREADDGLFSLAR